MATKKEISEQAMRILAGGHLKPDRTLDIREVMLALDQLRDTTVKLSTFENVKMGNYEVDHDYLSFYESVAVQTDAVKGVDYIELPASPLALYGGLGVYQITPIDDMEDAFIMALPGQAGLLSGTDALNRTTKTYCWTVGNRVYFKNINETDVTVLMAASSKDITENADYPVSPNDEAELLQRLIQVFSIHVQQPHDESEDGNK